MTRAPDYGEPRPKLHDDRQTTVSPRVGIVDDAAFDTHMAARPHPERPQRAQAARAGARRAGPDAFAISAREATYGELERAHDPAYIARLAELDGSSADLDEDTYMCPESFRAALRAAGGTIALVDALLDGRIDRGFAVVRPPGHHAGRANAMGFCLLNNVAVAAAHALATGLARVAIVDWDVHHGNGTEEIFWECPDVLVASIHQSGLFPQTGAVEDVGGAAGRGCTLNIPLSPGAADAEYRHAFERVILPVLEAYRPELILVSAGFDAHAGDPLADMSLSARGFAWMTSALTRSAEATAHGRIALVLEGGYDLTALEASVAACVAALGGADAEEPSRRTGAPHLDEIETARASAARFWPTCR